LSQLEGHTYAEIAQMLNVTVRTVQRYLTKAMEQCMVLAMTDAI
jgi:RNA polymerase sigma-70 factor (ECF subfamily)